MLFEPTVFEHSVNTPNLHCSHALSCTVVTPEATLWDVSKKIHFETCPTGCINYSVPHISPQNQTCASPYQLALNYSPQCALLQDLEKLPFLIFIAGVCVCLYVWVRACPYAPTYTCKWQAVSSFHLWMRDISLDYFFYFYIKYCVALWYFSTKDRNTGLTIKLPRGN